MQQQDVRKLNEKVNVTPKSLVRKLTKTLGHTQELMKR